MSRPILRDWFLPEDGIRREVISADIQSFLGNDATVRPGEDVVNGRKVRGYWIRAYRNLTTNMVEDLKQKSSKWDQESKSKGKRVNYEDSRTFREQGGGRHDIAGSHQPQVDAIYQKPPSRHGAPVDMMDYETAGRTIHRQEPLGRSHLANTAAVVGSYGEQPAYGQARVAPSPYVVQQGDDYMQDLVYPSSRRVAPPDRSSPQYVSAYAGHSPHHTRETDPMDARYAAASREPPRQYSSREDIRYGRGHEDVRYAATRDDPRYPSQEELRHRASREDPRYASANPHVVRDDPRYASARDPREDARYQATSREDPRLPAVYQDPAPSYAHAQPTLYDQYGRPVAYPAQVPQTVDKVYAGSPSRMDVQYSNSSRKRGAPPDERARHSRHR